MVYFVCKYMNKYLNAMAGVRKRIFESSGKHADLPH